MGGQDLLPSCFRLARRRREIGQQEVEIDRAAFLGPLLRSIFFYCLS